MLEFFDFCHVIETVRTAQTPSYKPAFKRDSFDFSTGPRPSISRFTLVQDVQDVQDDAFTLGRVARLARVARAWLSFFMPVPW